MPFKESMLWPYVEAIAKLTATYKCDEVFHARITWSTFCYVK